MATHKPQEVAQSRFLLRVLRESTLPTPRFGFQGSEQCVCSFHSGLWDFGQGHLHTRTQASPQWGICSHGGVSLAGRSSTGSGQVSLSAEVPQEQLFYCSVCSSNWSNREARNHEHWEKAPDAVGPPKVPRAHSERVCDITGRSAV